MQPCQSSEAYHFRQRLGEAGLPHRPQVRLCVLLLNKMEEIRSAVCEAEDAAIPASQADKAEQELRP